MATSCEKKNRIDVAVTNKKHCQKLRELLDSLDCIDTSRRIQQLDSYLVAIPLANKDVIETKALLTDGHYILDDVDFDITTLNHTSRKKLVITPWQILVNRITKFASVFNVTVKSKDIPNRWEKHGDMVLFPFNSFTDPIWGNLGEQLWREVADALGVKRVGRKSKITPDAWRSPLVELLLGEDGWVEHIENGIRYCYDVTQCMFSAGNVSEKLRVAGFKCQGETVVDMFAGIGYFTLPYLVHAGASIVHACEWNPKAVEALKATLRRNDVAERCIIHLGDNRKVAPVGVADRVNLGLIPSSEASWFSACRSLRGDRGGFLHVHGNVTSFSNKKLSWQDWANSSLQKIANHFYHLHGQHWTIELVHLQHVKSYAPRIDHLVLDFRCCPS